MSNFVTYNEGEDYNPMNNFDFGSLNEFITVKKNLR